MKEVIEGGMVPEFAIAVEISVLEGSRIDQTFFVIEFPEAMKKASDVLSLVSPPLV